MQKDFESNYHQIEANHFWFVTSRKLIIQFIKQYVSPNQSILDIGCSSGLLLSELFEHKYHNLHGIDISETAIQNCQDNGLKNTYVMDASKITLPDDSFDCIIASNIIEHINNDSETISLWKTKLKKNGKLIIMVPAFSFLWSTHDELNHHFRRYSKKQFISLLNKEFNIIKISYWNFFLFLPFYIFCLKDKLITKVFKKNVSQTIAKTNPIVNRLITAIVSIENLWLKYRTLPVGVSVFSVVEKNDN